MVLSCRENKGEFHNTEQYGYIPFSILFLLIIKLCIIFHVTEYYVKKYF